MESRCRYGQSKYQAKREFFSANPTATARDFHVAGIFSIVTWETYARRWRSFCAWLRDQDIAVRRLDQVSIEHVAAYLMDLNAGGRSAWTLYAARSMFRKMYFGEILAEQILHIALPRRRQADVKRGRHVKRDPADEKKYWQVLMVARASGLRRVELLRLRAGDVLHDRVIVHQGKGGKYREAPILPEYRLQLQLLLAGMEPDQKVLGWFPPRLNVHACRREYAQQLFEMYEPVVGPDKALKIVTQALGHERESVARTSYLRDLKGLGQAPPLVKSTCPRRPPPG